MIGPRASASKGGKVEIGRAVGILEFANKRVVVSSRRRRFFMGREEAVKRKTKEAWPKHHWAV